MPSIPRITHTQIRFIAYKLRALAAFVVTVQDTGEPSTQAERKAADRGRDGLEPGCH